MSKACKIEFKKCQFDKASANELLNANWQFDWSESNNDDSIFVGAHIDSELQGLIEFAPRQVKLCNEIYLLELAPHNIGSGRKYAGVAGSLLAYVAQDSFTHGFEGFMILESKTILINHYVNKYGAKLIDGKRVYFDIAASQNLIYTYLSDNS